MERVQEILESVGGALGEVANGEAVVGSPVQLGAVTVYPISRVSLGLGGGGGEGGRERKGARAAGPESGSGGGSGGAAKARPVAVLVVSASGVNVLPIPDRMGKLDALLERIPSLIERLGSSEKGSHA